MIIFLYGDQKDTVKEKKRGKNIRQMFYRCPEKLRLKEHKSSARNAKGFTHVFPPISIFSFQPVCPRIFQDSLIY